MSGSAHPARSAGRAIRRTPRSWRREDSRTTDSIRPRSARRHARRCYRPQPPLGRYGQHHGDRDLGAGQHSLRPNTKAPLAMTLKLNGYPRRSSASATKCRCGSPRRWGRSMRGRRAAAASRRSTGSSVGRTTSTSPHCRRHDTGRAPEDPRRGIPPHRRSRRSRRELDPHAEGTDARKAVLRVLRSGRDSRTASRADWSGRTSTRANSPAGGTRSESAPSPARRNSGVIPSERSSPPEMKPSRRGTTCPMS